MSGGQSAALGGRAAAHVALHLRWAPPPRPGILWRVRTDCSSHVRDAQSDMHSMPASGAPCGVPAPSPLPLRGLPSKPMLASPVIQHIRHVAPPNDTIDWDGRCHFDLHSIHDSAAECHSMRRHRCALSAEGRSKVGFRAALTNACCAALPFCNSSLGCCMLHASRSRSRVKRQPQAPRGSLKGDALHCKSHLAGRT